MRKVKMLTIILVCLVITMISVFGIYIPVQNRMENKLKKFSYSMDLNGARQIRLKVAETDEKSQEKSESVEKQEKVEGEENTKTEENYNKTKKIIEKRLKKLNVDNYVIKVDNQIGDIVVEIPENSDTDSIVSIIGTIGKFEIIDSETQEVLMNNDDIKLASVMYGSNSSSATSSGTIVYLNIEFTKEGSKKLEDISNKYVKTEEQSETKSEENEKNTEQADNTEVSNEDKKKTEEKKITMKIDDEEVMSTSFDEPITTGKLQLSIGNSSTDKDTLQGYVERASNMAIVLDNGNMPIKYEVEENKYIVSDITRENLQIVKWTVAVIVAVALIILAIKYKENGILCAISYVGLIGLFLILIRYANVVLSIEGIMGIVLIMILNYVFIENLLSKLNKEQSMEEIKKVIRQVYKEFSIIIVPILISVIAFCFIKWAPISSFGMVTFWGIFVITIYNLFITGNLLKIKASNRGNVK